MYYERFSVVLGHSPNASCAKYVSVAKTEIDLVKKKITISVKHIFFDRGKVKFLQIKQDTIKQKYYQNHDKK